mgnify:CR=1 FL=1
MRAWLFYALLSALCAAFVSIFGKIGLSGLDSSAATAVRAVIMAVFRWGLLLYRGISQRFRPCSPTERRCSLSR